MASRQRARNQAPRIWLRFVAVMMLAAAVAVGCSFDLAGRGTGSVTNGDSSVVGSGPRAELFVVDPLQVSLDEASGGTATVTVRLAQPPSAPVTVLAKVSPQGRITVGPSALTFTPENFGTSQTLTLKTTPNNELDPPEFMLELGPATSSDSLFDGADPNDVKIAFKDATKDVIVVSPRQTPQQQNFMIAEDPASTAKFFISLAAQPTDAVTITLRVPHDSEKDITISGVDSMPDAGVDAGAAFGTVVTMTFPADTPVGVSKPLVVRGVDDGPLTDGDTTALVTFEAAVSGDKRFAGQVPPPIQLFARDTDIPSVFYVKSSVVTTEPGATDTILVKLGTQPVGVVTIGVVSDDPSEGSVSPALLTFNSTTWNTLQTVTVKGEQDTIADGPISYSIKLAKPQAPNDVDTYGALPDLFIPATNYDDEAIAVLTPAQNPLVTSENGTNSSFTVTFPYAIVGAVQLNVSSSNTGEATVSPATLTFSANNWSLPQTVNVFGVNDVIPQVDGTKGYTITVAVDTGANTADPYKLSPPMTLNGTNADNDTAFVTVNPTALNINEGSNDQFTIKLSTQPIALVNVSMSSSASGSVPLRPPSVTFSPSTAMLDATNWSTGVTVTASIPQDCWAQGNTTFFVTTSVSSTDPVYALQSAADLTGNHFDDDIGALTAVPSGTITVSNNATAANAFQVVFATRPMAAVTLPLSIGVGASKITLNTTSIVVSDTTSKTCPPNFPVSITGKAIGAFEVNFGPGTGSDPYYSGKSGTVTGNVN